MPEGAGDQLGEGRSMESMTRTSMGALGADEFEAEIILKSFDERGRVGRVGGVGVERRPGKVP